VVARASVHTHSIRLPSGEEILVTRVVSDAGTVGYGYSLTLDATAARHMAECNAGIREGERCALPAAVEALVPSIRWLPA
jgi:hypothetical protein